jgi:hypothetical protein
MITQKDKFLTFDLGLASALSTLGYELWEIDKTNPRKAQFVFRQDKDIDKAVNDYWNNNLLVNARSIVDNQKMIKNRLYSQ